VFANARDKARQISDLSNLKQISLGVIMYTNDYDDTYPIGDVASFWGFPDTTNWVLEIAPYVSGNDVHVFYGPDDVDAGQPAVGQNTSNPSGTHADGIQISYGVNAFDAQNANTYGFDRLGLFSTTNQAGDGQPSAPGPVNAEVDNGAVCKLASVTQPTATIMLSDLQSSDLATIETSANTADSDNYGAGNASGYAWPSLIGCSNAWYWNATVLDPNLSASYNDMNQHSYGVVTSDNFGGTWMIPNPYRPVSVAYPLGVNGLVSAPFSSKSLANFSFADGHAKAMKPAATNPDGLVWNNPGSGNILDPNNEWISNR
jgi:prepilin-type processing-associated H-X9-DG protein